MDMNASSSALVAAQGQGTSESKDSHQDTPLEAVLKVILKKGCRAIQWDYGEIWLPDEQGHTLRCYEAWHLDLAHQGALEKFHAQSVGWSFASGEGLPGRVWQTQKAEWIASLATVDTTRYHRKELAQSCGLRAILGIPLSLNDTVVAVLVFYNQAEVTENPALLEMMESLMHLGVLMQSQVSEVALKEREKRFSLLVENIYDYSICLLSPEGLIQSWNPGSEKINGYQEIEIIGQSFSCFFTPEEQCEGVPEKILKIASKSERYEGKGVRVRKNGSRFQAHVVITTLRDEYDSLVGFTQITKDVTQEQRAVANLKYREAMYSSLFQQSNDGIILHDIDGNILEVNNRIAEILNCSFQAILDNNFSELYPSEELTAYSQAISTLKDQGSVQFETRLKGLDQTLIPVEVSASLMTVDDHILIQSIVRDITDRKHNEDLFHQQLEKETLLSAISTKIHQSLNLTAILETATSEIQSFLKTDRVVVYQFQPDWSGIVTVESVAKDWSSILEHPIHDPCFEAEYARIFADGRISAIEDVYNADFKPCYVEFLEQLQVKAYVLVPIITQDRLWGLLVVQHCQAIRRWQRVEVEVLQQIANQMAIAIYQAELYRKVQIELQSREAVEQELRAGENALKTLYEITSLPELTFEQRLEKLFRFGRHQFGLDIGQLSHIEGEKYTVIASQISDEITAKGAILSLGQQYCQAVLEVGKTLCITQAGQQSYWAEHPAYQAFRVEAYLGVPVIVNDSIYGTLCFMSHTPHPMAFQSVDREFLKLMAQWIGVSLERQQAAHALEIARDNALAGTKAKGEFLATMSHEIRTPMNAIIGMTGLLLDTSLDERQQDFAETIRSSGETLLAIINDILDFSKIESGNLELEQSDFSLRTCIEESLDLVVPQASRKKLELAYQVFQKTPSIIRGDVTRLRQILVNLLTNAVKFTPAGEIEIQVKSVAETVSPNSEVQHSLQISVRDTGIGIPLDRMNRLFKPFSQVDASTTRKYGGTGLGLVICKQLAEAMGGELWVESEVDRGTTFYFTIQAEAIKDSELDLSSNTHAVLEGKKILIVDDNATNRQILKAQTENWGMQPTLVASGREALFELTQGHQFDAAILDMQMPEMDGLQLAGRINRLSDYVKFPLVMLTSVTGNDIERKAMAQGFAAYLHKPVKHLKLFNALVDIFGGNRVSITRAKGEVAKADPSFGQQYPLRILLAEDNAVNQKLAIHLLARIGYRIEVAGNGLEVLEALERQVFDVILMDIQMPEMDGMTASRQIRERYTPCPSIVALTANAMTGDREKYLAAGMDEYLSKPIRIQELAKVLQGIQPLGESADPAVSVQTPEIIGASEDALTLEKTSPIDADISSEPNETDAPSTDTPSIDATTLKEMIQTLGDDTEAVTMVTSLFLEDSPQLLHKLSEAAQSFDLKQMEHVAHTLKSSSASVGALPLSQYCAELEIQSVNGTITAANGQQLTHAAVAEFERVKAALREHIDTQFALL